MRLPLALLVAALLLPLSALAYEAPVAAAAPAPVLEQRIVSSFDGTPLHATLAYPGDATASNRVPFVLMTHGWGGSRTTTLTGRVADLVSAGYGVLTWDSRGFGASGGEVMLNSPDFEVKDVQALLDWLVVSAPVQLDAPGDPRVGMSGGSYAGGIQLLAAAFDDRIDVLAPEVTWNDLAQSLAPNGVPKTYWTSLLLAAGYATACSAGHRVDGIEPRSGCATPLLARWYAEVMAENAVPDDVRAELLLRSPATYMSAIDVPTLLVQGFPDTLFDSEQAIANYRGVKANGAPVKLWLYDGGHAGPGTQSGLISGVVVAWFDCHLRASDCSRVGPEIEYFDGAGSWRASTTWPPAQTQRGSILNPLPLLAAAPANGRSLQPQLEETLECGGRCTDGVYIATGSVSFALLQCNAAPGTRCLTATGGVSIEVDFTSTAPEAFLFLSVGVKRADGTIERTGDQVTPVRHPGLVAPDLSGLQPRMSVTVDLVDVSTAVHGGESFVLLMESADPQYAHNRVPDAVLFSGLPRVTYLSDA